MDYVAIYCLDPLYIGDNDRIINQEFNTIDECINWLQLKSKEDSLNFYWPQYYDKQNKQYYYGSWWTENFMKLI